MCQQATKRIVLAFLIYFMSKLNSWMKWFVPKRDIWSSYGTKSAAADCKQDVNDDERCQSFALVFFQPLHKLFGNIDAITYFKPPDFTNINANMWLRQRNLSPNLELPLTYFLRSLYTRYMRELRKCSYVVTATSLDHDSKVQKTDLKVAPWLTQEHLAVTNFPS